MVGVNGASYSPVPAGDRDQGDQGDQRDQRDQGDQGLELTTSPRRTPSPSPPSSSSSLPDPDTPPSPTHTLRVPERSPSDPTDTRPGLGDQGRKRDSSFSLLRARARDSINPSSHSLLEKHDRPTTTAREYRFRRQRRRLWRLTIWEFLNTVVLCTTYFAILYIYARKETIDVRGRRIFNSLVTATSLLLGVNLAASLRSYAKLLRWRILAAEYRPLETFDLILGCDSLVNVIKLIAKARRPGRAWLPSLTQVLCALWLLVHLSATVLVGIVGLNYNLDQSTEWFLIGNGTISIVDLEALSSGNYANDLSVVQTWGVRGAAAYAIAYDAVEYEQSYYSDFAGETVYYFQDQNANDTQLTGVSSRYLQGNAYCQGFNVVEGGYGNLSYVVYFDGSRNVNHSLFEAPGYGGLWVSSALNSTCGGGNGGGGRCVDMLAFQAQASPQDPAELVDVYSTVAQPAVFVCNNTVSPVTDVTNPLTSAYAVSDLVARMLAGAMGWSDHGGTPLENADDGTQTEYMLYANGSDWAFRYTPAPLDMANWISSFTMGSVAIMDATNSFPRKYVEHGEQPTKAQILHVTWRYAGAILGVIPFLHFCTLLAVIVWANKAIIKDDSHLAAAKLYQGFLAQLGANKGCLLRGEEIVHEVGNPNVVYGWIGEDDDDDDNVVTSGGMKHVDVFEEARGVRIQRAFVEGWYDGTSRLASATCSDGISPSGNQQAQKRTGTRSVARYRDIDARDYF